MVKVRKQGRANFLSTIYGQVVLIITALSIVSFIAFSIIFKSVTESHLKLVTELSGEHITSVVEGALYHSMLTNDNSALESTLEAIKDLPGIEDLTMYDSLDNLIYSSYFKETEGRNNPNCKSCHLDLNSMFSRLEKSQRIINLDSNCEMSQQNHSYRLLMIRSPILNQESCYTGSCHFHKQEDQLLGSFIIRIPLEDLDLAVLESFKDFSFLAAITTLLLLGILMFFTRRKINRPLNEIIKASEAVSNGDRSSRIHLDSSPLHDIRLVSTAFNQMLDNLQSARIELLNWSQQLEDKVQEKTEEITEIQNEIIHVERMASLGKLSSSVAHELNNPLAGVLTYTKLVHKQLNDTDMDEVKKTPMLKYLKVIENETKRCGDIVKGLLDFSRKDQMEFKDQHIHKLLDDTYLLMEHQLKITNINFVKDFSATNDLVSCSENQIKQACIAIMLNALEAVINNGEIKIKTSNPDGNIIKLDICDDGVGIDSEDIPHLFEPFFSAKEKPNGTGLGLAIVHGIVQNHHGKVEAYSELGKGTCISIYLPVIKSQ